MAVRLSINESFVKKLKEESGGKDISELAKEAFSLFLWAIQEAKESRVLMTVDPNGLSPDSKFTEQLKPQKVDLPSLDRALEKKGILFTKR